MEKNILEGLTKEEYERLKKSGMFFVWFPNATGQYHLDTIKTQTPEYNKKCEQS